MTSQLKLLGQLLSPSWLSGLISIVLSLAVITGVVIGFHYSGSDIQLLRYTQSTAPPALSEDSDIVDNSFTANQLISDIPLLVLWGGVGVIAYLLTTRIAGAFGRATDLEHELDYVHADRHRLIREALSRFAVRIAALAVWLLYIEFTIHVLVPYVVALTYAASGGLGWFTNTEYLLVAFVLMTLGIHLHAIMLRLVMLKPRAFGQTLAA